MALYPNSFYGQFKLQPGARGEKFKTSQPGYRNDEDRINRSNIRLNTNEHDTPNIKYMFDSRLPVLFRYGYAYGFNQMVIPKGRIVAVDPHKDTVDFDMQKAHSTLTLANGGSPVALRKSTDKYKAYTSVTDPKTLLVSPESKGQQVANVGIEWMPLKGMEDSYSNYTYRPFQGNKGPLAILKDKQLKIDATTGLVVKTDGSKADDVVVPGNVPVGIIIRNEYTRDDDAFNGMAPGAVNTDCMVELPWFAYKDKAEGNPWGSAYGGLFPGALVKSDENGRFVVSPLSYEDELTNMGVKEYELERQQVVGQVYAVSTEMLPEGAAKWATWALSDRLNFEEFNPEEYPRNGRRGEDSVSNSPFKSEGKYPGYPYEQTYGAHDLHMMGGFRTNYDQRMNHEYQYENLGIPGLTDGYNAVKRPYGPIQVGSIKLVKDATDSYELYFRCPEVNIEDMKIAIGINANDKFVPLTEGGKVAIYKDAATKVENAVDVKYANELQGLFTIKVDKAQLSAIGTTILGTEKEMDVPVYVIFAKRGLAGVPTFMDWDGCVGSVKVLLQK